MKRLATLLSVLALVLSLTALGAAHVAAGPSGAALPTGDLPNFHQVFADDFTTNHALGTVGDTAFAPWSYAYNYPDTASRDDGLSSAWNPQKTISVNNGVLDYYLHTEGGTAYSAAIGREPGFLYGRFVVRMKADQVPGYKTAFLLWPDSDVWPRDGEIDFPEGDLDKTVGGSTHYQGGTSGGSQDVFDNVGVYGAWHTYAIQWTPGLVVYSIDDVEVHRTSVNVPNTPMHWVLQSERWIGEGAAPAAAAGHIQVDWAVMYAYQAGLTPTPAPSTATPAATATSVAPTATPTVRPPTPTATNTPQPTATGTPTVTPTIPPAATPTPAPSVTLPCTNYNVRPNGTGGTIFTCN